MVMTINWEAYHQSLAEAVTYVRPGRVTQVIGLTLEAQSLDVQIGELCHITPDDEKAEIAAEVMGFRDDRTLLMPLGNMPRIGLGSTIRASGDLFTVPTVDLDFM